MVSTRLTYLRYRIRSWDHVVPLFELESHGQHRLVDDSVTKGDDPQHLDVWSCEPALNLLERQGALAHTTFLWIAIVGELDLLLGKDAVGFLSRRYIGVEEGLRHSHANRDDAIDDEQPLPSCTIMYAVQARISGCLEIAGEHGGDGSGDDDSKPPSKLALLVPCSTEVNDCRVMPCLKYRQNGAQSVHLGRCLHS